MKCLWIAAVVASLCVLTLAASVPAAEEKTGTSERLALAKSAKISMSAALETAVKQVPGTVIRARLGSEEGKTVYSFTILPAPESTVSKKVKIDATSGILIGIEDESSAKEEHGGRGHGGKTEMSNMPALVKSAKISMSEALETACKQVPGTVIRARLGSEEGKTVYSFTILPTPESTVSKKVKIDATNGTVIKVEDEKARGKHGEHGRSRGGDETEKSETERSEE